MRNFYPLFEEAGAGAGGGGSGAVGAGAAGAGAAAGAAGAAGSAGTGAAGAGAAGAAAPEPFFKGLYGDDGKINKSAFDRLPDHLKQHKDVFSRYETVDALLAGFGNASALASKKMLTPLPADAPDNVRAERKALLDGVLGVPKQPKDYGIARPETLPEEHWDPVLADKFATVAHKHSISPEAVKEILALQLESTTGALSKGQQMETDFFAAQDKTFAAEVQKRGLALDKATELAARGAATLGIDAKDPIMKNAAVRLAMLRMTTLVSEDKLLSGDAGEGGGLNLLQQARDIAGNPQNPKYKAYHDQAHPDHAAVRREWSDLYRRDGEAKQKRGLPAP